MSKLRSTEAKPLIRKSRAGQNAKLSSRQTTTLTKSVSGKNKKETNKEEIVHLHQNEESAAPPVRQIPWWVFPEERGDLLGGTGGAGGMFPGPVGPGGYGGHGPFPPPRPQFPGYGPGLLPLEPFPPHPKFPGPVPFPNQSPIPIPGPQTGPFPPAYITVRIAGGKAFPQVNFTKYIPFYPGITIRQALASTGLVDFDPLGFIRIVAGIPVGGNTEARLHYNGRIVPQTILSSPNEPGSTVSVELIYSFNPDEAIPIPL
jgi:hypothetical protein